MAIVASSQFSKGSIAPLLAVMGGAAIAVGAWLPWMSYFAGLYPLRGVIGVNGRVLLAVGVVSVVSGLALARMTAVSSRRFAKRSIAVLGVLVVIAATWLVIGVRELTRIRASNSMLAPRPGVGLLVVLLGGVLLALVSLAPESRGAER